MTKPLTHLHDGIWLNRLSIDAVLVAVVWVFALTEIRNGLIGFESLLIIASATWLTYIGDHLLDVMVMGRVPLTGRHQFYFKHRLGLSLIWIVGFIGSLSLAIISLPTWKLMGGFSLLFAIILYFILMRHLQSGTAKTLCKRLFVSLIFAGGSYWMSEAWRDSSSCWGTFILWLGCCTNLLIITKWESSSMQVRQIGKLASWGCVLLLAMMSLVIPSHLQGLNLACIAGAFQFLLLGLLPSDMGIERRRFLADIILVVMGLVVVGAGYN